MILDDGTTGPALAQRYRLGAVLGEGAVGVVYAAVDETLGCDVAIKLVRRERAAEPSIVERAWREARACARINHTNIVRVSDVGTTADGLPFVVMEPLAGESLADRIARSGPLDVGVAIDVHMQLLDALAAAHAAGVLHRDIKPANVFLVPLASGVLVKLLDFGLALLASDESSPKLTATGLVVGSLAYLAPERLLGAPADERADVYAVGACLYESLTGEPAFHGLNPSVVRARILAGRARPIERDVGEASIAVVERALAVDPGARFASAAAMREALASARAGERRAPDELALASPPPAGRIEAVAAPLPSTTDARPPRPSDAAPDPEHAPPAKAIAVEAPASPSKRPRDAVPPRRWPLAVAFGALALVVVSAVFWGWRSIGAAPARDPVSAAAPRAQRPLVSGAEDGLTVAAPELDDGERRTRPAARLEPPAEAIAPAAPLAAVSDEPTRAVARTPSPALLASGARRVREPRPEPSGPAEPSSATATSATSATEATEATQATLRQLEEPLVPRWDR